MQNADVVMLIHLAYIVFVIGGQCLIVIGYHRHWGWVTNRVLRGLHFFCVWYVVVETWLGNWCPLTLLENKYRVAAGQAQYRHSFIADWVGRAIYYDAPPWVFLVVYTAFGGVTLTYWVLAEKRRTRTR